MTALLQIRNRQRTRAVNLRLLRQITRHLLAEHLHAAQFELCLHLVAAPEMACLNETFLQHEGSTDVITFDHSPHAPRTTHHSLHGEIFISLDDALAQARQFRTTWQSELTRYVIHGLLHLAGHDDLESAARKKMKRAENQMLQSIAKQFALSQLAKTHPATVAGRVTPCAPSGKLVAVCGAHGVTRPTLPLRRSRLANQKSKIKNQKTS